MRLLKVLLTTGSLLGLAACGGGGYSVSGVQKVPTTTSLTPGNWYIQAISNSTSKGGIPTNLSGIVSVSGSTVSLTTVPQNPCFPLTAPTVFTGSISSDSVNLSAGPVATSGFTMTVTGTIANGTNIDATYQLAGGTDSTGGSSTNPTPCFSSVGTVYGTAVPSLTGSFSGTITENQYPSSGNISAPPGYVANVADLTVNLTEANMPQFFPTASLTSIPAGNAYPLSGTVSWTNSLCYGPGTIDPTQSYTLGNQFNLAIINATGGGYPSYTLSGTLNDPSLGTALAIFGGPSSGVCALYVNSGTVAQSVTPAS